jgi:hypothetical protein
MTKKMRLTEISRHDMKETAGGRPGHNCICNCSCEHEIDGMSTGNGVYSSGNWAGGTAVGGVGSSD